jgi:predicted AlkP superfamily phosphohydrolase/phosphomutase
MKKTRKLYIIGVDSAPVWVIKELNSRFRLGGFARFMEDGVLMDLESTLPPITAAAWPSIYTGLAPAEHGVMNFFTVDRNYTKQLMFYDPYKHPPFWEAVADSGLKCLIVTPAMVTEPSSNPNVDMATGFPLKPQFSSEHLKSIAGKLGFSGEPEIEQDLKNSKITLKGAMKAYKQSIRARAEFSKKMMGRNDYDLVFVCFTEIDRMQHYTLSLPDWQQYVGPLYAEISKFIEWLVSKRGDANTSFMLVSDHGAQPIKKKLLLNSWLISKGYATLGSNSNLGGSMIDVTTQARSQSDSEGLRDQKYNEQLQLSSKQPSIRFICASVVENDEDFTSKRSFDMKNTGAFASLSNNPVSNIWINDRRFSVPKVKGTKARLVRELTEELLELKQGEEKAIYKVHSGKSYYNGTKLFIAPDLIVEARKGYTVDVFNHSEEIFGEPEAARRGDHTRQGVFGFYPGSSAVKPINISVLDIAHMVLDYYGLGEKKGSKPRTKAYKKRGQSNIT